MAAIRSKNTKPEVSLRKALHAQGFRFRLHNAKLRGRPDIVLAKHHAVVFVHGCFWHRHGAVPTQRFRQLAQSSGRRNSTRMWLAIRRQRRHWLKAAGASQLSGNVRCGSRTVLTTLPLVWPTGLSPAIKP
ncbi:hypothetical protein [Devosia sp.]|uniref:hypothetical protein n=1 Tax=Devosia sp. TaxID=1871048 RepID=UPI00345B74F0